MIEDRLLEGMAVREALPVEIGPVERTHELVGIGYGLGSELRYEPHHARHGGCEAG